MKLSEIFQSTHPLRGATGTLQSGTVGEGISIHAPLAGCDRHYQADRDSRQGFQSTHPLRGATLILPTRLHQLRFQSTPPLRGATCWARSI